MNGKTTESEREEAARRAYRDSRHNIRADVRSGAGCMMILGLVGLVFVLPTLVMVGASNLRSARAAIATASFRVFFESLWGWLRHGSGTLAGGFVCLFSLAYCFFVWQWLGHRSRWPWVLPAPQLWAASSIYFLFMFGSAICLGWRVAKDDNFGMVIAFAFGMMSIPFLCLTIPLWHLATRHQDESGEPDPRA